MIVAGLDLSLTSAGISNIVDGACTRLEARGWGGQDGASDEERSDRIVEMTFYVLDAVPANADLVMIERPLYRSTTGYAFDRACLFGGVYAHLHRVRRIPIALVHINTLKAWGSGKGGSNKNAMIAGANTRWGLKLTRDDDDEADAIALAEIGAVKLGDGPKLPFRLMPRHHNGIHSTGIAWPSAWTTRKAV